MSRKYVYLSRIKQIDYYLFAVVMMVNRSPEASCFHINAAERFSNILFQFSSLQSRNMIAAYGNDQNAL